MLWDVLLSSWVVGLVGLGVVLYRVAGRFLGRMATQALRVALAPRGVTVTVDTVLVVPLRARGVTITSAQGSVELSSVRITTHVLRFITTLGQARLLTFAARGIRVRLQVPPSSSAKPAATAAAAASSAVAHDTAQEPPTGPPPAPPLPGDSDLRGNALLSRVLLQFRIEVLDVLVTLQAPEQLASHDLTLRLPRAEFSFKPDAVAADSHRRVFVASLAIESAVVAWHARAQTGAVPQRADPASAVIASEELLAVVGASCSLGLELTALGSLLPTRGALFDLLIERVSSAARIESVARLRQLAVALSAPPPPRAEVPTVQRLPSWAYKIDLPKVRLRLPLIAVRLQSRTHSLNLDADVMCNISLVSQGVGAPVVATGEVAINMTLDAAAPATQNVVNPLARLTGLHCFVQHSFGGRHGESVVDLKLTTTGVLFRVVPDHSRAVLTVAEAFFAATAGEGSAAAAQSPLRSPRPRAMTDSTTGIFINSFRYHVTASLNSIVVQVAPNRDDPPLVTMCLETPSVSLVGERNAQSTLIVQCTFVEVTTTAYKTRDTLEFLPLSDHALTVEALALRRDLDEVSVTAKSASVQVSPALLTSLLPLAESLPLAEGAEFFRARRLGSGGRHALPARSARAQPRAAIALRIGEQVNLHLVDTQSNEGTEISVLSLQSSSVRALLAANNAVADDKSLLSLGAVSAMYTRHRPTALEDSTKQFPAFFGVGDVDLSRQLLKLRQLFVRWDPEVHLVVVELVASLAQIGRAYRSLLAHAQPERAGAPKQRRGARTVPRRPRSSPAKPLQLDLPPMQVEIADVRIDLEFTPRSAMRLAMENLQLSTSPALRTTWTNALYSASKGAGHFRDILRLPNVEAQLLVNPRSVVSFSFHANDPHWTLPHKFFYGEIIDETATVAKAVGFATKDILHARGLVAAPPGMASRRRGFAGDAGTFARDRDLNDSFGGDNDDVDDDDANGQDNAEADEWATDGEDDSLLDDSSSTTSVVSSNARRPRVTFDMTSTPVVPRQKPPRFVLNIEAVIVNPRFDLLDSDFEVHLATAYRVRVDELAEMALREELLLRRVAQMRKFRVLTELEMNQLRANLDRENTRIFIRRVRDAIAAAPKFVHRISGPVVNATFQLDLQSAKLKKRLRRLNKKSRFFAPSFHYMFETLVGLRLAARVPSISLQHRDLPSAWIDVQGADIQLDVVVAEEASQPRNKVFWTVLPSATRTIRSTRSAIGIKFYHNITLNASSFTYTMGKAYDWYQRAFQQSFILMVPENINVSQLNWWDKMRFQFHGLLELRVAKVTWNIMATLNPYDVASYFRLNGDGVVFSYKTNELRLTANLFDACVSTLSTPFFVSRDFVFVAGMQWTARGDPEDFLVGAEPSYEGPFVLDASTETHSAPWDAHLRAIPDAFDGYRATSLVWSFDVKVSPPAPGKDVVTLDTACFSWFIKWARTLSFPEMYIRPPIEVPKARGFFSGVLTGLRLRLHGTQFNAAYWESREVRDPTGFKLSIATVDVSTGINKDEDGWAPMLGSLKTDRIESFMFTPEDYARFYDSLKNAGTDASVMMFTGVPFVVAPTMLLVQEQKADSDAVLQHFTLEGLRVTYTPPTARLISSWRSSYTEWLTNKESMDSEAILAASKLEEVASGSLSPRELTYSSERAARSVSENQTDDLDDVESFFARHNAEIDYLIEVKDAQVKLVTIIPEGAALLVADDLAIQVATNDDEQTFIRIIWKELELYCSGRTDLWFDRIKPSPLLPRILTKCSLEFDYFSSPDELVRKGGAEAKGSLSIVAPTLLAHMTAFHFTILRAVFSKFFAEQTSMSEQHKELLATIQYKLQLAPETVGDVGALRGRVRNLGVEIKDLQSKIRDLELELLTGKLSPVLMRRRQTKSEGGKAKLRLREREERRQRAAASAKVCDHCGTAFVNEVEVVEVDEAFLHARCVVDFRTTQVELPADGAEPPSRLEELRQRLLQKQRTFQASTELLGLLMEGQKKVRKGANALPTWKLRLRLGTVHWHLMAPEKKGKEGGMFCEALLKNLTTSSLVREDDSGIIRLEVNRVSILNHLPQTEGKYLHALQPLKAATWSDRDVMMRVFAAMRCPVGGITVFDHFEVNVVPLRVSITGDLYQHIFDYMFLRSESRAHSKLLKSADADALEDEDESGDSSDLSSVSERRARKRLSALTKQRDHYTDFHIASNGEVYYAYEETDYVRMRQRAERNRMFVYWKLTDMTLLLTFRMGFRFENLTLALHSKEFRTCAWSWGDLIVALKSAVIRDVLGQTGNFLKHAVTPQSRLGPVDDVVLRKSKLQAQLDSLGRTARDAVHVVTRGKVGRTHLVEEERRRVASQLQQTLEAAQREDDEGEAIPQELLDQVTLPDEILLNNAQKRMVDQQITELKAELLLGNVKTREAERDRLKKRNEREERRRRNTQPANMSQDLDESLLPTPQNLHKAVGASSSPAPSITVSDASARGVGDAASKSSAPRPAMGSQVARATPPPATTASRPPAVASTPEAPLRLTKGPLAKLKEEL